MTAFSQSASHTMKLFNKAGDMRITKLAFKQRFTQDERVAIREAAKTIPQVYDFEDLVNSATFVDLMARETVTAVNYIEQSGLIGAGRAAEILSAPVEDIERWKE
jgi:hypothetical protein